MTRQADRITDLHRLDWMVRNKRRWVDGNGSYNSTVPITRKAIDAAIRAQRRGKR